MPEASPEEKKTQRLLSHAPAHPLISEWIHWLVETDNRIRKSSF